MHILDFVAIGFFLLIMVAIGIQCRGASANFADYIRMGSRSTWWLAGSSIFMMGFSSITFTGISGQAYLAGWSVLIIFWVNALNLFFQAAVVAPRLRRTRADTPKDALRMRFGRPTEQFMAYYGTITSFVWGGTFLLSLSTFLTVILGIPIPVLILIVGAVVIFYSVAGGQWSVQITDSLQMLILIAVTVAFSMICLAKIGGVSGLFEAIRASGLSGDFAIVKPDGYQYTTKVHVEPGMFTWMWIIAMVSKGLLDAVNIQQCGRYLSLKDEKESRKAAALAAVLMIVGSAVWFIPPMVARIMFSEEVNAMQGFGNVADGAYAVAAMNLLPPGFLGLIVIAMLAATMSSMDSFLTGSAGIIVKNIYLPLWGALKWKPREGKDLLQLAKYVNLALGIWAVCMAFFLQELQGSGGIFGIMMKVFALIAPPTLIPMVFGFLTKRLTVPGLFSAVGFGALVAGGILIYQQQGNFVPWHTQMFIVSGAAAIPCFISMFFYKKTSPAYQKLTDDFFVTITTPINVQKEVGATVDGQLLRIVGGYLALTAVGIALLIFWSPDRISSFAILGVAAFLGLIGGTMLFKAARIKSPPAASEHLEVDEVVAPVSVE